jgi:diguanylate cyclase (GGDEF)-like protein
MSIQNKLLFFFVTLLILFFSISETWMLYYGLRKTKEAWYAQDDISLKTILDLQKQSVSIIANELANDPAIKAAYRENDPRKIIETVLPFWNAVRQQDLIYEIHFFKPPAISFVNFSNFGSMGKDVSDVRTDIAWVTSSFKQSSHLMMCKTYAGVRATYPIVDDNGTMLGGLALGKKVDWIPATLKKTATKDAFLVYTVHAAKNLAGKYYTAFLRDKEILGDYIFAQRTLPITKAAFSKIDFSEPQQSFVVGGKEYELDLFALYDFNHEVLAYIGVLNSLDRFNTQVVTRLLINLLLVGATFTALFFLFRKRIAGTVALISEMKTLTQHFKNNRFEPLNRYDLASLEAHKGQDEIRALQVDILTMGEALRNYHEEMEAAVAEKTQALSHANEELTYQLFVDQLTGLPNRNAFFRDAAQWESPSVATIDVDGFKTINDLYGVELGNQLLRELGAFCVNAMKGKSISTYRISADEFVFASGGGYSAGAFEALIADFIETVQRHQFIMEKEALGLFIDVAAGITYGHGKMLENADMALGLAKRDRKSYVVYSDDIGLYRDHQRSVDMMHLLKRAVEQGGIRVFFQPIVDRHARVKKYESLLRIFDGETMLQPQAFLAFAKKTRHYKTMTHTVIDRAFEVFADSEMIFTVNLTAQDILDAETVAYLHDKLRRFHRPQNVVFEIVESESLQGLEAFEQFIDGVKSLGATIAIDDFGSGYSNFSYMLKLSPKYLKIDGDLIKHIDTDANARAIVRTIVNFAKELHIKTIAEYIHSEAVFEVCKALGIDEFQGFYFGKPSAALETPDR